MFRFSSDVFKRGPRGNTEDYTQPSQDWYRIGLNIKNKYGLSEDWLGQDNNPGEWYVAYHGIRIGDRKTMHQVVSNI